MSYRYYMMSIANKLICGVDFGRQPDNELWYITTDGQKTINTDTNLMGGWGRQNGLQVISHTYKNGIGKVQYNAPLKKLGEGVFGLTRNTLLVSLPRTLEWFGAGSFGGNTDYSIGYLVLLNSGKVNYNREPAFKPIFKNALYVQPNCAQYYKENLSNINIIEKKI